VLEKLKRLAREPLVHFLLIGAGIYGFYGIYAGNDGSDNERTVTVTAGTGLVVYKLETSEIVPHEEKAQFESALTKMRSARDSVWADVTIILLAFGFTWLVKSNLGDELLATSTSSWLWSIQDGNVRYSMASWWYFLISGPLFQVILYRWLWRFYIWIAFLFRLSCLPLVLYPTHPDLAGGIGFLGFAQKSFAVVFLAFATFASSTIARDILSGVSTHDDEKLQIAVLVVVFVGIIYAPLVLLFKRLLIARRERLVEYGSLGVKLSESFHRKWIEAAKKPTGEELMASADPSATADYTATYDNVNSMRLLPASIRNVVSTASILVIPFLPLILAEYSPENLLTRLVEALV